jgi:hypothetical protein
MKNGKSLHQGFMGFVLLISLAFCTVLCVFPLVCLCFCLVYPMLPVSLDSSFLIVPSVFSNVYLPNQYYVCGEPNPVL